MSKNSGTVSGAFSERIKQLRKAKGASQAQVAEYLGVTKQAYSLYETGKREPPFATLLKIAEYFGTDTDTLLMSGDTARVSDPRLKFALFGETEIDDDVLDDVKRLASLSFAAAKKRTERSKPMQCSEGRAMIIGTAYKNRTG